MKSTIKKAVIGGALAIGLTFSGAIAANAAEPAVDANGTAQTQAQDRRDAAAEKRAAKQAEADATRAAADAKRAAAQQAAEDRRNG